jgi:subtilisin family serine protease
MRKKLGRWLRSSSYSLCASITVAAYALPMGPSTAVEALDGISIQINPSAAGSPLVSPELEGKLASLAVPLIVDVERGDSIRDVVKRRCLGATNVYDQELQTAFPTINPKYSTRTESSVDAILNDKHVIPITVFIPYCLSSSYETHIVRAGETLWTLFDTARRLTSGQLTWDVYQSLLAKLNDQSALRTLEPDAQLLLPQFTINLTAPKSELPGIELDLRQEIGRSLVGIQPRNWGRLEADGPADSPAPSCAQKVPAAKGAEAIFNDVTLAMLTNDYISSPALQARLHNEGTWTRQTNVVGIAILDSGFSGESDPLLAGVWRRMGADTAGTTEITPETLALTELGHGTSVLSVLLGGALFGRVAALKPYLEVIPYSVLARETGRDATGAPVLVFHLDESLVIKGLNAAAAVSKNIRVVNLSMAFLHDIAGFDQYMQSTKPYLIVVAAGNENADLSTTSAAYPAMYGGRDSSNLLTVGAIDLDGKWLPSSNRGKAIVDIAAWGCSVPALWFDSAAGTLQLKEQSGTSFAAPQVGFVAGLLMGQLRGSVWLSPVAAKRRLLYSADIHSDLSEDVKDGRVLNARKALAVYSDVIELKTGNYIYGRVHLGDAGTDPVPLCPGVVRKRSQLRKIAEVTANPAAPTPNKYIIYSETGSFDDPDNNPFVTERCTAIAPAITFDNWITATSTTLKIADIRDIVFEPFPH